MRARDARAARQSSDSEGETSAGNTENTRKMLRHKIKCEVSFIEAENINIFIAFYTEKN